MKSLLNGNRCFEFVFMIFLIVVSSHFQAGAQTDRTYADSIIEKALILNDQYGTDSAIVILEAGLKESFLLRDYYNQSRILKEMGILMDMSGEYQKSVTLFIKALEIAETNSYFDLICDIRINLGIVYFNLRNGELAIEEYNQAFRIASFMKDTVRLIKVLNNLGNTYMTIFENMDVAEQYFTSSTNLAEIIGFDAAIEVGYNNLVQIYMHTGRSEEAEYAVLQAYYKDSLSPFTNYNVANFYLSSGKKSEALEFFERALDFSGKELELKQVVLRDISSVYAQIGNYKMAYIYFNQFAEIREKLHQLETQKYIIDIQAKYENAKKEQEIEFLTIEKNRAIRMIGLLAGGILILAGFLVFLVLYARNQKIIVNQKNELYEKELFRLEQEKMLVAANEGLKGEEQERERLSRDLHDGLGGMLSGLKMTLLNIQPSEKKHEESLGRAIEILDDVVAEVRLIAGNVTPFILKTNGLEEAISSFCTSFQFRLKDIEINFHHLSTGERFASVFELAVYRISQELINNAVKYSGSHSIDVQLLIDESRLFLSVTDFGIGMNEAFSIHQSGKGLDNVRKRVETFNGRFELSGVPGQGTECIIEFSDLKDNRIRDDKSSNC